ncbi:MAG: CcmD family protein [Anaerolineae bacterium]
MRYLFFAYAITWLMVLGYVISLARRRRQVLREAETLTQTLERQEKSRRKT